MLLIFDLDDTLYQSFELRAARDKAVVNTVKKHKKLSYEKAEELLEETRKKLKSDGKKYTTTAVYEKLGIPVKELYNSINSIDIRGYIKNSRQDIELIENLSKMHTIVVFSNSPKFIVDQTMEHIGMARIVSRIYNAEDLGVSKPDPAVFRSIAQEMGFEVKDCVSIGDSVHKEIVPAKSAGMKTVLLLAKTVNVPKEEHKFADFIINDLKELPEVLSQIT